MKTYTKVDHSACRVDGLGTIAFRSSYRDNIYLNVTMKQHSVTRYGYNTPAGETMEFTVNQIKALPHKHPVRNLYAQYRLMQREDIKDFCKRQNMSTKEFWYWVKK